MSRPLITLFSLSCFLVLTFATAWASPSAPTTTLKPTKTPEAQATEKTEKGKGKKTRYQGLVAAISAKSLTLATDSGTTLTFAITAKTVIKLPSSKQYTQTLAIGARVNVQAQTLKGTLTALRVQVVPGKPIKIDHVGIVTAYIPDVSITIEGKSGTPTIFTLTPTTKILPAYRAYTLAVGQRVTIIAPGGYRGQLVAKTIVMRAEADDDGAPTPTPTPAP